MGYRALENKQGMATEDGRGEGGWEDAAVHRRKGCCSGHPPEEV